MQSQSQQPSQTVPVMYQQSRAAQQGYFQGVQPQVRVMQQAYPQGQTGMAQQAYPQGQTGMAQQAYPQGQTGMAQQAYPQGQTGMAQQAYPQGQTGMAQQAYPQGQARVAQQAYPYMITTAAAQAPKLPQKKNIALIVLGAIQIVIGVTCISIQIAGSVFGISAWFIMSGIWCGIMYILSGSFGVVAGKTRGRCSIIAHMVLCILSAVLTIGLIIQTSIGLSSHPWEWCRWYCDEFPPYTCYSGCDNDLIHRSNALNGTLLGLGLVQAIIAITASAMSCGLVCCKKKGQSYSQAQFAAIPMVQGTNGNMNGQPMALVRLPMQPGVNYVPSQAVQGYQPTAALQAPAYEQTTLPAYEQSASQIKGQQSISAHVQVISPQATGCQQATQRAQGQKQTVARPQQHAASFPLAVPAAAATAVPVHTANRTKETTPRKAELPDTPPPAYVMANQGFQAAANTSAAVADNDRTAVTQNMPPLVYDNVNLGFRPDSNLITAAAANSGTAADKDTEPADAKANTEPAIGDLIKLDFTA